MPKFKQPDSLKDSSMDFLVIFFADYLKKYSTEGSLLKIRQCVAFIKEDICPEMTWKMEAEFCYRLIEEFLWSCDEPTERPKHHIRAVAEVVMDRKIIGLKCTFRLLDFLEPDETRRILGLKELDLGPEMTHILENFHLEDITEFVYEWNCTDSDLQLIGQNCRKLLYLDIRWSKKVTDVGLRALRGCPDLQYVCASFCSLSESGVLAFLSANKRIREFNDYRTFDWFSVPNSSVYPSIESIDLRSDSCSNGRLRAVTDRFPNLKSLKVLYDNAEDLEELKYLRRLSHLRLEGSDIFLLNEKMADTFRLIGANLLSLTLSKVIAKQQDVDSIFHICSNLENLYFWYESDTVEKLVIPSHRNIKTLKCSHGYNNFHVVVQFGEMPNLEELILERFELSLDAIEAIIFDHTNFRQLKKMAVTKSRNRHDFHIWHIREIVRAENLDLELEEIGGYPGNYHIRSV